MLNPECTILDRSKFDTTKINERNKDSATLLQSITSKKISSESADSPNLELFGTDAPPGLSSLGRVLEDLTCREKAASRSPPECLFMMKSGLFSVPFTQDANLVRVSSLTVQPQMSVSLPQVIVPLTQGPSEQMQRVLNLVRARSE